LLDLNRENVVVKLGLKNLERPTQLGDDMGIQWLRELRGGWDTEAAQGEQCDSRFMSGFQDQVGRGNARTG
jgi:hypothetical protein